MAAAEHDEDEDLEEELPAWSLPADAVRPVGAAAGWPALVTPEWAWGGATGAGVTVCILDSGVEAGHPLVGGVSRAVAISVSDDGDAVAEEDAEGDLSGHGTACAGIVRSFAPECELVSVRVLGAGYTGSGPILLAGLRWAVEQGYDVINMSLSTTKSQFVSTLHDLADRAYFDRTILVASAHNMPVESYPWRFASVISVGSHEEGDPYACIRTRTRRSSSSRVASTSTFAWVGGGTIRVTGNSFATPHVAGICALDPEQAPDAHALPAQERPQAGRRRTWR